MSQYVVARLPLLSPEGEPITADAAAWRVEPALRYGELRLRNGPLSHTVDLRTVLAPRFPRKPRSTIFAKRSGEWR